AADQPTDQARPDEDQRQAPMSVESTAQRPKAGQGAGAERDRVGGVGDGRHHARQDQRRKRNQGPTTGDGVQPAGQGSGEEGNRRVAEAHFSLAAWAAGASGDSAEAKRVRSRSKQTRWAGE